MERPPCIVDLAGLELEMLSRQAVCVDYHQYQRSRLDHEHVLHGLAIRRYQYVFVSPELSQPSRRGGWEAVV